LVETLEIMKILFSGTTGWMEVKVGWKPSKSDRQSRLLSKMAALADCTTFGIPALSWVSDIKIN
jgi:hypothetical protein